MPPAIKTTSLSKQFKMHKQRVVALESVTFEVNEGERIAFIGPNGAGKSTTIKMLTGILYPSSGDVQVLGMTPWKERRALGYKIGTVFGQRSQLWYHLPPQDTFDLLSKIYEIPQDTYKKRLVYLAEAFAISEFLTRPVRSLSLGQRMRCEIIASLLHNPKVLFLDEPTVGLDVTAKLVIRNHLTQIAKEQGTTLFLTSHDTADIEQVCDRVIILDKGRILRDCSLRELRGEYVQKKVVTIASDKETLSLDLPGIEILRNDNYVFQCEVDTATTPIDEIVHAAIKMCALKDVTIEDPTMEEIIREIYG